jgi:hypothetical protein
MKPLNLYMVVFDIIEGGKSHRRGNIVAATTDTAATAIVDDDLRKVYGHGIPFLAQYAHHIPTGSPGVIDMEPGCIGPELRLGEFTPDGRWEK